MFTLCHPWKVKLMYTKARICDNTWVSKHDTNRHKPLGLILIIERK